MPGTLIAIGGALRLDGAAFNEFYQRSGGADGRIIILPTASQLSDAGQEYVQGLARLGLRRPARVLPVRERADSDCPEYIRAIREASGIFLTGGDQMRLTRAINDTPIHEALLDAYQRGTVIGGTSAGTAALSAVMIARGFSGCLPRGRILHFAPGLGLNSQIIFDQHFRQRNRLGRLMYAVTASPDMLGIGVDEDTAAVIEDGLLRVTGSCAVTIVDGSEINQSDIRFITGRQPVALSGIRLHILSQGGIFDLNQRCAELPTQANIPFFVQDGVKTSLNNLLASQ